MSSDSIDRSADLPRVSSSPACLSLAENESSSPQLPAGACSLPRNYSTNTLGAQRKGDILEQLLLEVMGAPPSQRALTPSAPW
jgi:hypothetical protein